MEVARYRGCMAYTLLRRATRCEFDGCRKRAAYTCQSWLLGVDADMCPEHTITAVHLGNGAVRVHELLPREHRRIWRPSRHRRRHRATA